MHFQAKNEQKQPAYPKAEESCGCDWSDEDKSKDVEDAHLAVEHVGRAEEEQDSEADSEVDGGQAEVG